MEFKKKIKFGSSILKKDKLSGLLNLSKNYYTLLKEPVEVESEPLIVKIEPTINCNLRCVMCDRTYWNRQHPDMSLEQFKRITDQIPKVASINLQGLGEPTLNKNIFEMVKYAKEKKIEIGFYSNGTLINDVIARKILDSGLDYVNISVDAATPEVYNRIRVGANFDIVVRNIKRLISMRKGKKPKISIWMVAFDTNIDEIINLVRLAKELNVDELVVQSAHSWGKDYMYDHTKQEKIKNDLQKVNQILKEAKKLSDEIGLKFRSTTLYPTEQMKRECKMPWLTTYITVDGYVTPCCLQASDPRLINFGNIFKEDFGKIWNNDNYKLFRQKMKEGSPKVCDGCPGYFYKSG